MQLARTSSIRFGLTPSSSTSALPLALSIGTSISSASSQVAKACSPINERNVISPLRISGRGRCSKGRGGPRRG